jgi:hypothetical protein
MNSPDSGKTAEARQLAERLLEVMDVSRIIVVDDVYSENSDVETLIGLCTVLDPADASTLPHLEDVDFRADREVWVGTVRKLWMILGDDAKRSILKQAHALERLPSQETSELADDLAVQDSSAAASFEMVLSDLENCEFIPLSLTEWNLRAEEFLADERATHTLLLFDRDFRRELENSQDEGLKLIREVSTRGIGYCGLISHTIQVDGEQEASCQLAEEGGIPRDRFVAIAKGRLTAEAPDYKGLLRLLRLTVLSGRCANIKSKAWKIFEASLGSVRVAVDNLAAVDFDHMVLASSRREGVSEIDTLFRVFGILMRQEAHSKLRCDPGMPAVIADARKLSILPEEVAVELGEERFSLEAIRLQRFEIFEQEELLNQACLPIDLGDIFEKAGGQRLILLAQPCDLMVRSNGKRPYDEKHGRMAALVELKPDYDPGNQKASREEIHFYDEQTGASACVDFAKAHQVQLSILDLCALRIDGDASMDLDGTIPDLVIEPWRRRYELLWRYFSKVLKDYHEPAAKGLTEKLRKLLLPVPSTTLRLSVEVKERTVRYDLKRVMRLRQPRSGALLTKFAQYHARAAFEHPLGQRGPTKAKKKD